MRLLVCGGRDYDKADVFNHLERFAYGDVEELMRFRHGRTKLTTLIHGGARGADEGAAMWGKSEGLRVLAFPADWKKHGKAAGPIRNRKMIEEGKPDAVIAFAGGRGTANMVALAEASGIPVLRVDW
jgi:predicted polyphosphate/ATP-dependent NAD kinase